MGGGWGERGEGEGGLRCLQWEGAVPGAARVMLGQGEGPGGFSCSGFGICCAQVDGAVGCGHADHAGAQRRPDPSSAGGGAHAAGAVAGARAWGQLRGGTCVPGRPLNDSSLLGSCIFLCTEDGLVSRGAA